VIVAIRGRGARYEAVRAAIEAAGHDISDVRPQVGVCAGWSEILTAEKLALPEWGWINCHAGPVPHYRGGSPLNWQIIEGMRLLSVSVLKMTPGIDDGPILAMSSFELAPDEDISHAHAKANALFAALVPEVLDRIATGRVEEREQNEAGARYWHQRNDSDGEIDWTWSAERVHNFVRALTRPYPGAWTLHAAGYPQRIWKTSLDCPDIRGRPGHIFTLQGKRYAVCGDRALQIIE
jgi:methionyl-tRNA formyltransferase